MHILLRRMPSLITTFLLILISTITSTHAGTVLHESLASASLGRDYRFTVYLPDGYQDSGWRYPVLYLLHGANGDENDWLVKGKAQATLDSLISAKRIPPMVVVMPGHKAMWWVDGNADPAETVLLTELLPTVETRFRVFTDRQGRAFAGLSAGGYATIRLMLSRPALFAAGAALSPAIYEPDPPGNSSAIKDPPFQKNGHFDSATWQKLNWRPLWPAYAAQNLVVPLYINSGDRDRFSIPVHAAIFHHQLLAHQPGQTVLRIVDGDHEWGVWERSLGDALQFIAPYLRAPSATGNDAARHAD